MAEKERLEMAVAASEEGALFGGLLSGFPGGASGEPSTQPPVNNEIKEMATRSNAMSFSSDTRASRASSRNSQADVDAARSRGSSLVKALSTNSALEVELAAMKEIRYDIEIHQIDRLHLSNAIYNLKIIG